MPLRTRSACSFTTRIDCAPAPRPAPHSTLAGAEARPRRPCPISGVPTHKHRPARCACALGRPPVACSDASLACAGRTRRVWTQPRWPVIASLAQWNQSAGLRSRMSDVQFVHEAPPTTPRWTSGEVLGPSSRRGGFDSRTGYQLFTRSPSSSSRFEGCKPAATIGRRRNPSPTTFSPFHPGVAQPGRATALGAEGCTFNSCRSDQPVSMSP